MRHIESLVATQQSFAGAAGVVESCDVAVLLEEALRISTAAEPWDCGDVSRQFETTPNLSVDKNKLLQVLVNLISNARDAMEAEKERPNRLEIRTGLTPSGELRIEIADNGVGIAEEGLSRVFQHGYTTKERGHGFGLHASANHAAEMGGRLSVRSAGPGEGATFVLELPLATPEPSREVPSFQ